MEAPGREADRLAALEPGQYDAAVAASADLDPFCCSTDWVLPAYQALGAGDPLIAHQGDAWVLLDRHLTEDGARVLTAFEPSWGFACPAVGPDGSRAAELLVETLAGDSGWDMALLAGIVPGSPRWGSLVAGLTRSFARVAAGEELVRQVADLSRGYDAWFARRSKKFRASTRRTLRLAEKRRITTRVVDDDPGSLWDAVGVVEARSWKGRDGGGLTNDDFLAFYRSIAGRCAPEGRWRARLALRDEEPVGFIFGAVRGRRYRGLQLSYAHEEFHVSIGNLLQSAELTRLAEEGVDRYDLGMDMEYKQRWADEQLTTRSLIVFRR